MKRVYDVPSVARLKRDAHKGDRGRVLVIAGSLNMSGAARLTGWGALRGGAGLVTIATPDVAQPMVAGDLSCALTLPLPASKGVLVRRAAAPAREAAESADAVAIGPGLTTRVGPFLRAFLKGLDKPIVIDADALNVLAQEPDLLHKLKACRILTPHPGEASRLLGEQLAGGSEVRREAARQLADTHRAVIVLKGAGTVVCDGERVYVNKTGNPGMATGGSGDVLTGLIAARLAAGAEAWAAAVQGVYVHGCAGDLAAAAVGEAGMIATDIVGNLPTALADLGERGRQRARGRRKSDRATGSRRRGRSGR